MNCEEADGLLLDYVEETLDDSDRAALDTHLSGCGLCRSRLRDTRKLLGALSEARQHQNLESAGTARSQVSGARMSSAAWQPGSRLGDFEILGEIGRGGMGVVYRARQVSLNRVVALKVLPALSGVDAKAVSRFVREAQAAARLHHTNIVPVYAQGEHEGHFYYAMELVEGESLDKVIRLWQSGSVGASRVHGGSTAGGPVGSSGTISGTFVGGAAMATDLLTSPAGPKFRQIAQLICGSADGLEHAHTSGVLHRDIKPQNMLLGRDGHLHITDFGLARLLDEPGVTLTGEMIGTPAYMSPEQVGYGKYKIDHRTDVFSLGVTMYELLTLERPFEGATREQLIARICTREPKPPRKINSSIPVDLETICLRAIEKEPVRRYATAAAMAADLRRFAENRPIHARRVGLLEKGWKFVRRHPAMTTIVLLSVILLSGAGIWRTQAVRARQDRVRTLISQAFDQLAYDDYRKPTEAQQLLAQAESIQPIDSEQNTGPFLTAMGLSYLRAEPDRAVKNLTRALAASVTVDDRRRVLYLLAWAERQRTGRLDGAALGWLEEADRLGGERSAEEHFFRGQALVRHRPDEAIGEYRLAREGRSNYAQAMLHLARALNTKMYHARRHDTFDEQVRVLLNACELQSSQAYPCYLLSITYRLSAEIYQHDRTNAELMEEHFTEALRWAREAQRREPQSPRGYACEAEYWEARGDFSKAIDARKRGEPHCKSPDDLAEVHEFRWRLYFWTGQHQLALKDLDRVKEFTALGSAGQGDARRTWFAGFFPALVQMDMGRPEEAARLVRAAVEAEPTSARAVTSAACVLRLLGRGDEAIAILDQFAGQVEHMTVSVESCPADWGRRLYELCGGRETLAAMQASVGEGGRREVLLWSAAYLFDGLAKLASGDREGARAMLDACEQTFDYGDYCYAARVFLGRMATDPQWPKSARGKP